MSTLDPVSTFGELLGADAAGPVLTAIAETWELDPSGPFTAHFGIRGAAPRPADGGEHDAAVRIVGFDSARDVAATCRPSPRASCPSGPPATSR